MEPDLLEAENREKAIGVVQTNERIVAIGDETTKGEWIAGTIPNRLTGVHR